MTSGENQKSKLYIKADGIIQRLGSLRHLFALHSAQRFLSVPKPNQKKRAYASKCTKQAERHYFPTSCLPLKRRKMTVAATNLSATYGISRKVSDAQTPDTIQFSPPLDQSLNSPPGLPMRKYSSSTNIDFPRNFNVEDGSTLSRRLASSAEGKFTIIDSRYKDSTDESFDDSSDVEFETSNDAKIPKSPSAFCIGHQTTSTHLDPTRSYPNFRKMGTQNICGSRFKIVPVESRYKRGRWQAWDYYLDDNKKAMEDESLFKKAAVHLTGDGFLNQNVANNGQFMGQSHPVINPPKMIAIVPPTPPIMGSSSASMFAEPRKFDENINSFAFGTPPTSSPNFYIPSENSTIHSVNGQQMLMQGLLTNQEVPLSPRAVSVDTHHEPEIFGSRPNSPENVHDQLRVDVYSSKGASSPAINISPISATSSESRPTPENGPPPQMSGGRLTPSAEILLQHYGLERSLSATSSYHDPSLLDLLPGTVNDGSPQNAPILSDKAIEELKNSSSINGAGGAGTTPSSQNAQIVAIDSKIEQAMDLVKTHLMFAVREEVESLRNKILELETTVVQLEAENSILREHVPSDILQNLALHSSSNGSGSSPPTLMTAQ